MESYKQAVKYFKATNGVLKRYDNIPSLQMIQRECEVKTKRERERERERERKRERKRESER